MWLLKWLNASGRVRVAWPPGLAFRYSGGGVTVLQQMLLDVTGESYAQAVERLVLGPEDFVEPKELRKN